MVERRCRYCERIFQPSKYQPGQSVCSDPGCQRRRRAEYHRQKMAMDPEYRQVCGGTANNIRPPWSGTASSSTFGTRSGVCAIF
jgi:hypothetical protein